MYLPTVSLAIAPSRSLEVRYFYSINPDPGAYSRTALSAPQQGFKVLLLRVCRMVAKALNGDCAEIYVHTK